jgi:hypothetical protein
LQELGPRCRSGRGKDGRQGNPALQ